MSDTTPLSPAAQAVLEAYGYPLGGTDTLPHLPHHLRALAAALRAATELLSKEVDAPKIDGSKYPGIWHSFDYLNAIAAELDDSHG